MIWAASWENQRSGFQPGPTQTRLYSYRKWLEAWNFRFAYTMQTHWIYAWRSLIPKMYYWKNGSYEYFDIFQACFNKKGLCLFYDNAYMGRSTPTTDFVGAIWHIVYTMLTHWPCAWRSLVHKTLLLTKLQLCELGQFFRIVRGYSCAMIVHTLADQLLSQLLMGSLNTLLSHYRHIGNLHEEVWCWKNNFLQKGSFVNLDIFSNLY